MNAAIVVEHEMQRHCMPVICDLLAVGIRQSREPSHTHSHREVLPLDLGRAYEVPVRVASNDAPFAANTLCWRIARFILRH
jgi:hypothetical protein